MNDFRCKFCHRLLAKGIITEGMIAIKCPKCNEVTEFGDKNVEKAVELVNS